MREANAALVVFLSLAVTPVASAAVVNQSTTGDKSGFTQSTSQSYQRVAAQTGADRSAQAHGTARLRVSTGALVRFRVPGNAPYYAHELIEAAKLGNTAAGIAAMAVASAKVRAAARSAVIADGFGGVTKKTASAEIEAYFARIARGNPAAAIELSQAIAPGTGLRRALRPSRAVAASLSRMAVIAHSNLPVASALNPAPSQVVRQLPKVAKEEAENHPAAVATVDNMLTASYQVRAGDAEGTMHVDREMVQPVHFSQTLPDAGLGAQVARRENPRSDQEPRVIRRVSLDYARAQRSPLPRMVTTDLGFLTSLNDAGSLYSASGQSLPRSVPRTVTTGDSFLALLNGTGSRHSARPLPLVATGLSFLASRD